MKNYCILIRDADNLYGEKDVMKELNIPFVEYRSQVPENSLIIGRYSVIPYYKELEQDLKVKNSILINSYHHFHFCSDLKNWYGAFPENVSLTPKTWFTLENYISDNYEGPVILKGETNSKRDKWATHMFANNKDEARQVYCRLLDDGLVGQQSIYIRKYEQLKKLIDGVSGMPIPNEWRVMVLNGKVIGKAFYWSTYLEDIQELGINPEPPSDSFINAMIHFIGNNSNFYSIDFAQRQNGSWIVVELNEGQQSGLNGIDTREFYTNLKKVIEE